MPRLVERPYWFVDEDLAWLFGYSKLHNARRAMARDKFPIPAFKLHGYWCVDRRVVLRYFQEIRREQMAEYEKWVNEGRYLAQGKNV